MVFPPAQEDSVRLPANNPLVVGEEYKGSLLRLRRQINFPIKSYGFSKYKQN
jgi:hypothetical protein